jgi:hypothetical protein
VFPSFLPALNARITYPYLGEWRNGSRGSLKNFCLTRREGSSPSLPTNIPYYLIKEIKMNKLNLVGLVVALSLCACVVGTDSSETDESLTGPVNQEEMGGSREPDTSKGAGCLRTTMVSVTVENHTYWVTIPVACNLEPYIYMGDPGPDMGNPWTVTNPVPREKIIQAALPIIDKHLNKDIQVR